jgi:DNA-binding MarR family transcriptional regulator
MAKLGRLVERRMAGILIDYDLTTGQYITLAQIRVCPRASRAELASNLQITPQAVGGLTEQLVRKGVIIKASNGAGYPVEFTISAEGSELLERATPAIETLTEQMMQYFLPNLASLFNGASRHLLVRLSGAQTSSLPKSNGDEVAIR